MGGYAFQRNDGVPDMKKENCPFCGHRWIRRRDEAVITCPNCHQQYEPFDETIEWQQIKKQQIKEK